MKKHSFIAAILALLLLLSSCSQNSAQTTAETSATQSTTYLTQSSAPQVQASESRFTQSQSQQSAEEITSEYSSLSFTTDLTQSQATETESYQTPTTTESETHSENSNLLGVIGSLIPGANQSSKTTEPHKDTTSEGKQNSFATKKPQTESKSTTKHTSSTTEVKTCTVTIDCRQLKTKNSELPKAKEKFVPKNGYILKNKVVQIKNDDTAFDIIKRACKQNKCTDNCKYCQKSGIQIEFSFTPAFKSYYIEGIHQLYEKDGGTSAGWLFKVNGNYPTYSCSEYTVAAGDSIVFEYSLSE